MAVGAARTAQAGVAGSISAAILLIAGTTVGGGFLALPYVVAPAGFAPSAVTLCGIWLYFIAQSMVVVELLCNVSASTGRSGVGITAVAGDVFGQLGRVVITMLIVVLTKATIVSQISKAGTILSPYIGPLATAAAAVSGGGGHATYVMGCAATTMLMALVVFAV